MFEDTLSIKEVIKKTGLSRTTIWRNCKKGIFPNPVTISPGRKGWRISDLNAWSAALPSA